jgi:hypothetical protein
LKIKAKHFFTEIKFCINAGGMIILRIITPCGRRFGKRGGNKAGTLAG